MELDHEPHTLKVIQHTQPFRVRDKLKSDGKEVLHQYDSDLDLVLTGVGELPLKTGQDSHGSRGSIFYDLAARFGVAMDEIISKERVVGDLAFTALRSDGEPCVLYKSLKRDSTKSGDVNPEAVQCTFYSAVDLPVLERMAQDKNKTVLLVARSKPGKYKIPAITASIRGERHSYASNLVIDEATADYLLTWLPPKAGA